MFVEGQLWLWHRCNCYCCLCWHRWRRLAFRQQEAGAELVPHFLQHPTDSQPAGLCCPAVSAYRSKLAMSKGGERQTVLVSGSPCVCACVHCSSLLFQGRLPLCFPMPLGSCATCEPACHLLAGALQGALSSKRGGCCSRPS